MTGFIRSLKASLGFTALWLAASLAACGGSAGDAHPNAAPTASSTMPADGSTGVATYNAIFVSFSRPVDPATINSETFLVKQGPNAVSGAVSYDGQTASFLPTHALASGRSFMATISGAKYLTGNRVPSNFAWTFTTAGVRAPLNPVLLGTSGNYVILAQTAITNVPTSAITGDIAISPAAESYLTGFALTDATGYATAPQVVGKVYAADQAEPTPTNLTTAINDMGTAYTDAAGRPTPDFLELGTGAIGGLTLTPGLYKWTSGITITSDVTITGGATDVWIFQTTGTLLQAAGTKILLSGGAQAKNIFWQVAGGATLGTTSHFEGILLSQTAITLQTGASANGRLLAQTAVALDSNAVTQPGGAAVVVDTTPPTVASTSPATGAIGVALNATLGATFSEPMAPATLSAATFTLAAGSQPIAGSVAYAGTTATFVPAALLPASTVITATVTTGAKDVDGNALAAPYAWSFTTAAAPDTTPPTVTATGPASNATGVAPTANISATFSEAMAPATFTTATFTLAAGGQPIAGSVTYADNTATFHPAVAFSAETLVTATIAAGVKDLDGNALAASYSWSFTPDTTPPTVTSTNPADQATDVAAVRISATFSEAMAAATITNTSFTVSSAPSGAAVSGTVAYDQAARVVTFRPGNPFASSTVYTAKIAGGSAGVTDLAGNRLLHDFIWSFTSRVHVGLAPVLLGTSGNYAILAQTAISTVPTSAITGDIAISPAAESYITGFALTDATGYATATQVVGKVYAADQADPTPINLTTAVSDMGTAYTDAAGRPTPDYLELGTGAIGGMTLPPGLYKWTSTVTIPADVTLTGGATDVWIFQISGDLMQSSGTKVFLSGGALAKNVFWQVAGAVNLGTTSHFEGIILSQTAITMQTGASMNGRLLAQSAVALDSNTVTQPAP